jgi:hypothetical protein
MNPVPWRHADLQQRGRPAVPQHSHGALRFAVWWSAADLVPIFVIGLVLP